MSRTLVDIGDEKHRFLLDVQTLDQILRPKNIHDEFKSLLKEIKFMALHAAFAKLESLHDQIGYINYTRTMNNREGLPTDDLDSEIAEIEKKRDSYMTYTRFMGILKQPEDI